MRISDFDEILICYRENNSKVGVSELIGHLGDLGGKSGAWKITVFPTFLLYVQKI